MTSSGSQPRSRDEARAAKAQVSECLAELPGVAGVGLEKQPDGGWCVRVNVTSESVAQAVAERLPEEPSHVPVHVRITGAIEPLGGQPE